MSAKKFQVKIEILKKGDTVLNVWENRIAVRKKSGEVEIFIVEVGEDGLPRIAPNTFLVTYGNESVPLTEEIDITDRQNEHHGLTSPSLPTPLVGLTDIPPSSNPDRQNQNGETLGDIFKMGAGWAIDRIMENARSAWEKRAAAKEEDKGAARNPPAPVDANTEVHDDK